MARAATPASTETNAVCGYSCPLLRPRGPQNAVVEIADAVQDERTAGGSVHRCGSVVLGGNDPGL
jgi:hypothetical protein